MLDRVHIRDYQAHQDTVLDFGPGFNVIVGPSNSGKSSCVRAICWPITNRPLGTGFIRVGQDEAEVTLEETRSDGTKVSVQRGRGKTRNEYILNGDQDHPFTAFGSNPPEDVLQALNLRDANIQTQFAPYFLVFDSPGQVGSAIRQVTGMEKIDKICDVLSSRVRTCKGRISDREADLQSVQKDLDILSRIDLDKIEGLIGQIEKIDGEKSALEGVQKRLSSLVSQLVSVQMEKVVLPEERLAQIREFSERGIEELLRMRLKYSSLQTLLGGLTSACSNKVVLPKEVDQVLGKREGLVNQYNTLCTRFQALYKLVESLASSLEEKGTLDSRLKTEEEERSQLMLQINTCPWCSSPLTEVTRNHLLEHSK